MRDPYKILGLSPEASAAEIKLAYRRLAKRFHPDKHDGDAGMRARFQEVTEAYNLLKDAPRGVPFQEAAKESAASPSQQARWQNAFDFTAANKTGATDGDDLFSELFGGLKNAGKRVFRARGEDQHFRLSVTLPEAARGGRRRVKLPNGKTLEVRIPAGIEHEQQIRLKGQGLPGHGGAPAGDVLITIAIEPHAFLRREGRDIHMTLPVTLAEVVLGARIEVPTLDGPVALTIPKGSNSGTRLRLKGKGIRSSSGTAGDQYLTLTIMLPEMPDEALRDFAAGWGPGLAHNPRKGLGKL